MYKPIKGSRMLIWLGILGSLTKARHVIMWYRRCTPVCRKVGVLYVGNYAPIYQCFNQCVCWFRCLTWCGHALCQFRTLQNSVRLSGIYCYLILPSTACSFELLVRRHKLWRWQILSICCSRLKRSYGYFNWSDHIFLQNLYVSRLFELSEIDGLQIAIRSALDILSIMLSRPLKVSVVFFTLSHA